MVTTPANLEDLNYRVNDQVQNKLVFVEQQDFSLIFYRIPGLELREIV